MRNGLAYTLSPLCLRLALAAVFIWAGAGKLFYEATFTGALAETLADMGVLGSAAAGVEEEVGEVLPEIDEALPDAERDIEEAIEEIDDPEPLLDPEEPLLDSEEPLDQEPPMAKVAAQPIAVAVIPAAFRLQDEVIPDELIEDELIEAGPLEETVVAADLAQPPAAAGEQVTCKRLYGLCLAMKAGHIRDQWPDFLDTDAAYQVIAWLVALTEFIGGLLLLVGLLTRVAALGAGLVMLGALWLTQIGPALGADAFLGFLPEPQLASPDWTTVWEKLLFQFTLLMAALAVVFMGPGRFSIDAMLFREKRRVRVRTVEAD